MSRIWRHQSGNCYELINDNIIDATNGHFKTQMVLYRNFLGALFVREYSEFIEKFTETELKEIPIPE